MKGIVLKSRLVYLDTYGEPGALERVIALLEPRSREVMTGIILAVSWYPFEVNAELDRAIATVLGGGRASLMRKMGARSATDSLATSHRNLVRSRDPQGLLKHSAQIHNLYYDTGRRTYEQLSATSARLRTFECRSFSEEDCLTNVGWHEAAIGVCGGINPRVTHSLCRTRGDDCCEHLCEWE